MRSALLLLAAALSSIVGIAPAAAQDYTIRAGIYIVQYNVQADDLSGPFTPSGLNADLRNVNTAYFAVVRRLTSRFDIELAAGIPPKTETVAKGPATVGSVPYDGEVIATAKWFSPTLLLIYRLAEEDGPFQPFIGAGLNYTHFYDRKSTDAGNAIGGGPTSISLPDSYGPAATVGFVYRLDRTWSFDASFSMAKVKSELEANTAGVVRKSKVDFNPRTWVLAVGYSF